MIPLSDSDKVVSSRQGNFIPGGRRPPSTVIVKHDLGKTAIFSDLDIPIGSRVGIAARAARQFYINLKNNDSLNYPSFDPGH